MRQEDFNATHLVKAVKGLPLNPKAYAWAMIGGHNTKIVETNKDSAIDWFVEWAAQHINSLGPQKKVIVPVPSSKSTVASPPTFRTAFIASKLAAACANTISFPELRFASPQRNSREEGGSRSAEVLYPLLRMCQPLPDGHIILLDDLCTGGGHLKASAWIIEDQGRQIKHAICCGRSVETQLNDPFTVPQESIDISR
jgi:predicted amidophosphoribosyltransferase